MKNNLVLGLDLDGTLADHTEITLSLAKEFGFDLPAHQTASEVIKDIIPEAHYKEFQRKLYAELSHLAKKMDFVEEALKDIQSLGWNFILVSRRKTDGHASAQAWLKQHLPGFIPKEKIFFVEEDSDKNIVCERESVLAFVDDQTGVLQYLNPSMLRILIDPFGNWDNNPPKDFIRVKSWHDIPPILSDLK